MCHNGGYIVMFGQRVILLMFLNLWKLKFWLIFDARAKKLRFFSQIFDKNGHKKLWAHHSTPQNTIACETRHYSEANPTLQPAALWGTFFTERFENLWRVENVQFLPFASWYLNGQKLRLGIHLELQNISKCILRL